MNVAGNRIVASYEGQPVTCYECGDTEHISGMPQKAWRRNGESDPPTNTRAHFAAKNLHKRRGTEDV